MENKMPLIHKFAFLYASKGFRGSSYLWKFVRIFAKKNSGETVFLPNGFPLVVDETDWIARTIYEGTYERPLINLLNRISVNGCLVDVGANIGVTLWNGMRNSTGNASFVAVEPSEQCQVGLELSTRNVKKPGRILQLALGQQSQKLLMHGLNNPAQSGGGSLIDHAGLNGETIEVEVRTLDELISEGEISRPVFLLKIDTEGYEEKILAGAMNLISSFEVQIFILEVSPSLGSNNWVRTLFNKIATQYTFFRLTEHGLIKEKTSLSMVGIKEAILISEQWNLIIIRNDYLKAEKRILRMII
jgi:FkbM family methyltransferase